MTENTVNEGCPSAETGTPVTHDRSRLVRRHPSTSAMHDLICAIIQDEASYDPVTNTWDVGKAATSIIAAFDSAPAQ